MSKEVKELQKRWHVVMDTVHSNSHVVAFMNSRVGQYLDDHPFAALSLLVFIAASAIPIAFFLVFVVTTTVLACIGVIVMEGACQRKRLPMEAVLSQATFVTKMQKLLTRSE
ncbi:promethin isoform X2 [Python bivittatus]|uniref:Promethin isoform X2 n=1 Tax=Python bivittatus TaxID=176946 RepID=A0A9F5MR16_PYTBI|nr:promethin isoform X2 [Python bivittatus]